MSIVLVFFCYFRRTSNLNLFQKEAPPGIISAFLGEHLNEVLNSIEEGRDLKNFSRPHLTVYFFNIRALKSEEQFWI